MIDLQILLFVVGSFVTIVTAGGFLFTISEFRRFDRETREALERQQRQEGSSQPARNLIGLEARSDAKKFYGAGI